jgi:hypothetical protein
MLETNVKRDLPLDRPIRPGTEVRYVRDEMRKIGRTTDAGSLAEAREACARLMFDFQVVIVSRPHVAWQFAELLGRCGATGLSRRFQIAAGFNQMDVARRSGRIDQSGPPLPTTENSSPARVLAGELTAD